MTGVGSVRWSSIQQLSSVGSTGNVTVSCCGAAWGGRGGEGCGWHGKERGGGKGRGEERKVTASASNWTSLERDEMILILN